MFEAVDLLFDKRTLIKNPHVYPWSIHGYIVATFPGKKFGTRGTGTLIGHSTVLTAAHCLYYKELNPTLSPRYIYTPASEVTFYAGMYGGKYVSDSKAIKMLVHPEYLNNDENFDFGVIKLNEKIGEKVGWASMIVGNEVDLDSLEVNITGYPGYKGAYNFLRNRAAYDMYTMKGLIETVDKHTLRYFIDTSGGQSGAGVWGLNSNDNNIIECYGIHVSGSKIEGNRGIRINDENFDTLSDWLAKFESNEPKI